GDREQRRQRRPGDRYGCGRDAHGLRDRPERQLRAGHLRRHRHRQGSLLTAMTGLRTLKRVVAAAALAGLAAGGAHAAGLQVEPSSVTIAERAEEIWLVNTGDAPLQAQVRV